MPVQSPIIEVSPASRVSLDSAASMSFASPPRLLPLFQGISRWMHAWFIWLLLAVDLLAAFLPGPGQGLRDRWGEFPSVGVAINFPSILLAMMLFIAGLSVRRAHLRVLAAKPLLAGLGIAGCWLIPLALLLLLRWPASWLLPLSAFSQVWLGLVIVAAVPSAQSSVAWTQNARGNVLLCLTVVLCTTLISPLLTPQVVRSVGVDALAAEAALNDVFSARFLVIWVVLPSLAGWLTVSAAGTERIDRLRPLLSVASCCLLLLLNYINASDALPALGRHADAQVVAATLLLAAALCGGCFGLAYALARLNRLNQPEKSALVYALGMKNNGIALTLMGQSLSSYPLVSLVLICYILLQHFIAGVLSNRWLREAD